MSARFDVLVVGSVNLDTRVDVQRLPRPGETIAGSEAVHSGGGKGANQAVAAAAAGASVALISAVGDDAGGHAQRAELRAHGIDVGGVRVVDGVSTGGAFICVNASGENTIVLTPGANASAELPPTPPRASVVLLQNEIRDDVLDVAAALATQTEARLVINAAPVPALIPASFRNADPLVVNEHEAAELLGDPAANGEELAPALLDAIGARSVIVTYGARGSVIATRHETTIVPAHPVTDVVDTTGAGDTFVGALAARLALGDDLVTAAEIASIAAARSVGWAGARAVASSTATV